MKVSVANDGGVGCEGGLDLAVRRCSPRLVVEAGVGMGVTRGRRSSDQVCPAAEGAIEALRPSEPGSESPSRY
eukprot:2002382-Heterocapsa_arctica.AAC.1